MASRVRLALFVLACACAADPAARRAPILGGTLDDAGFWPGIAFVAWSSASLEHTCSGTLVDADPTSGRGLVLTAAHCILDPTRGIGLTGHLPTTVRLGPDGSTRRPASRFMRASASTAARTLRTLGPSRWRTTSPSSR